jgi:hypothetical protein
VPRHQLGLVDPLGEPLAQHIDDPPGRVVVVRLRVAEVGEDAVAQVLRDVAAEAFDGAGGRALVGAHDLAQVLGIVLPATV